MNIRKFEAESLKEAMAQAKMEMGDDALIINTRKVTGSPTEVLARPRFELIAAADDDEGAPVQAPARPAAPAAASAGSEVAMVQELASLRSVLESLVGEGVVRERERPLTPAETRLREAGVDGRLASDIARSLFDLPSVQSVAGQWAHLFNCLPPDLSPEASSAIALVGPTGSGKSSAVASLAALAKHQAGLDVGIIGCDASRIGASAQMETLASLLGVAYRACADASELGDALDELSVTCHLVLIDTRGCSHADAQAVAELARLLSDPRIAVHLALPAALAPGARRASLEAFDLLHPQRLIVTKLDEAPDSCYLFALAQASNLPLSFVASGQDLTGSLEPAAAEELAAKLAADLIRANGAEAR